MRRFLGLFVSLVLVAPVGAADIPIFGKTLQLKDPASGPEKRSVRFRDTKDPAIDPGGADDPRVNGATLEIVGRGAADGTSGVITLPAGQWTGLGRPEGSKGYKFTGPVGGVKKIMLKSGKTGGSLVITGGKSDWPYSVPQAQDGPIDVRLTIGGDVYCARFTTFDPNEAGKLKGRDAAAPATCAAPVAAVCGDGVAQGTEECDDGGTTGGDGCSATCQLEDTSALCAGVPSVSGTTLGSVRVASGLSSPVHVTAPRLDPNRLFVVEQGGRIRIVKSGVLLGTPFLNIASLVVSGGEQGLLSVAFHPDYESNGYFFVNYTRAGDGATVVSRFSVSGNPDVANASSEVILQVISQPNTNHNGGQVAFGPDGGLYVGMGDGGGANDPDETAQDDGSLLGKLLRFDVSLPAPITPVIWAKGLRNPWRFSFDRLTGEVYIGDVGQDDWEEVDVTSNAQGINYGWDIFEATHCFEPSPAPTCPNPPTGFTMPVLEYGHGPGCSITGGFVYRGCCMPALHGTYFYSDACAGFIRTFEGVSGGVAQNTQDRTADVAPGGGLSISGVTSFGEDARGEIYVVDYPGGEVFKIVP